MKILRCLVAFALTCGLSSVAKADAVDFQMVVIDPPPPIVSIITYDILSPGVTYTDIPFSTCAPGELPSGSPSYQGCISFLNGTGVNLTSLTIGVPNAGGIVGQTADCPADPNKIFSNPTCPLNPTGGIWTLLFTGGNITPGEFFVIAENGASPDTFPHISTTFGGTTPEPGSFWLLSTGVLSGGLFLADWRRRTFGLSQG